MTKTVYSLNVVHFYPATAAVDTTCGTNIPGTGAQFLRSRRAVFHQLSASDSGPWLILRSIHNPDHLDCNICQIICCIWNSTNLACELSLLQEREEDHEGEWYSRMLMTRKRQEYSKSFHDSQLTLGDSIDDHILYPASLMSSSELTT